MPIVITIPDDHPHYCALLRRLDSVDSKSRGFVSIEQLGDGMWCARLAFVSPTVSGSRFRPYAVQIGTEKRST